MSWWKRWQKAGYVGAGGWRGPWHSHAIRRLLHRQPGRRAVVALTLLIALAGVGQPLVAHASGTTYYVNCNGGYDGNSGTSSGQAWQSLNRANSAYLSPGSSLLLARGCTWTGPLNVSWSGTSSAPITIDAYGSGAAPVIQNAANNVYVTGSYVTVQNLSTTQYVAARNSQCNNNPEGSYVGFHFAPSASYDTLQYTTSSNQYFGVYLESGSHNITVYDNSEINNNVMSSTPGSDAGGVGIAVESNNNLISHNYITGSDMCSLLYGRDGSAVEVYGASYNNIEYNTAVNNEAFSELGKAGSTGNSYGYNVVTANETAANFLITRGPGDTTYGPVWGTVAYNNSVYLTGSQAYALQCLDGCSSSVLTFKNNIVWSNWSIGYADNSFNESNNVYWSANGSPTVWFSMNSSDKLANPQWVNPGGGNLQLSSGSPATGAGTTASVGAGYTVDMLGKSIPSSGPVDVGAYQVSGSSTGSGGGTGTNLLADPSFEQTGNGWLWPWTLNVTSPAAAYITQDTSVKEAGAASARVNVTTMSNSKWYAQVQQAGLTLNAGSTYQLTFWAMASVQRGLQVVVQQTGSPYTMYVQQEENVTTQWQQYTVTFTPSTTVSNAAVEFNLAEWASPVWLDNVSLTKQ